MSDIFLSPRSTTPSPQQHSTGEREIALSIERSRKRHLSEGLLRGDLAADRLKQQEASASPLLKKSKPAADMALTMQEFKDYMDRTTNKRLESLDSNMTDLNKQLGKVNKNVKANSAKLDLHEEAIKQNKVCIDELKEGLRNLQERPAPGANASPEPDTAARDDPAYWKARRSVRLWPIHGRTREEIWNAANFFFKDNLALENQIAESMIESIDRVEIPSGPGVRLEALVVFKDSANRDTVMGAASKLSGFIDSNNKPAAGIRMEVPARLRPVFRTLFRYGQTLRQRHGPGTRRHVKFDDTLRSLYLNAKLPGDEQWTRVSFDVARRGIRARQVREDVDVERFNGPRFQDDRPRAASVGAVGQERATPMQTDTWTGRRTESVTLE